MNKVYEEFKEETKILQSKYLSILFYDLKKGYSGTYRSKDKYRLCTIVKGKKQVILNNEVTFSYNKNNYIILPPFTDVKMTMPTDTHCLVFEFENELLNDVLNSTEFFFNPISVKKLEYSSHLYSTIVRLNIALKQHNENMTFIMDMYAKEIMYNLIADQRSHKKIDNDYDITEVAKRILSQPGNESITLQEVSDIIRVSQSSLVYYFKRDLGITPKQFQNNVRMNKALSLLEDHNVTECSIILGFDNISYFIRLFKAKYNETPKQYQKRFDQS